MERNVDIINRIKELSDSYKDYNIDGYLIPSTDEYLSEYSADYYKRLRYLTGFTGSNGYAIIYPNKVLFFTDGRYTLQAKKELNQENFNIIDIANKSILSWIRDNVKAKENIYVDPKFISIKYLKKIDEVAKLNMSNIKFCEIDKIINFKKISRSNQKTIFTLPLEYSGLESDYKIKKIIYLRTLVLLTDYLKSKKFFIKKKLTILFLRKDIVGTSQSKNIKLWLNLQII